MVQIISAILPVFAVLATLVSAADITGFQKSNCPKQSSHSASFMCHGIESGACCTFKTFEVDSILWTLPATSNGFAYSEPKCPRNKRLGPALTLRANKHPIKERCFNYRTGHVKDVRVRSAKWVNDVEKRGLETRDSYDDKAEKDCQEPNVAIYADHQGNEHQKHIPTGKYDLVQAWIEHNDYEMLAELEDYSE